MNETKVYISFLGKPLSLKVMGLLQTSFVIEMCTLRSLYPHDKLDKESYANSRIYYAYQKLDLHIKYFKRQEYLDGY